MSEKHRSTPEKSRPRRTLILTEQEQADLQKVRDRDPRPYLRERAAALLKIAAGQTPHQVAVSGLLKPRHPETIYLWLNAYEQTRQLKVRPATGRGAFSPRTQPDR